MHAILTSLGTDGDIFPYLGLARVLVERGHHVTLVVPESFESLATSAGADFRPIVTRDETEALFTNPDLWHSVKGGYVMARWGRAFISRQFELLSQLISHGQTIIVANPGVLAARIIRDLHKIPLVTVVLQPGVIPSNVAPPVLPAGPRLSPHAPQLIKESYWWMIDRLANLLTGRELNRVRQAQGLAPVKRLFRWWLSPDLVLGMFPEWFGAPSSDWPAQFESIDFPRHDGRSLTTLPSAATEFLNSGSPPIAFTPGSEVRDARIFFKEAIAACVILGRRGLLLTKHQESIPESLPGDFRHFEYLPFQSAFPRCSAVVHHGGIGTVAKALAAGVPQIVRPLGWDQFDNADRISKLGVGTINNTNWPRRNSMISSLQSAFNPMVISRCQQVVTQFSVEDPNHRAVTSIELLFERFYSHRQ